MARAIPFRSMRQGGPGIVAAAALMLAAAACPDPAGAASPFAGLPPLGAPELATLRGGFQVPGLPGVEVSLGVDFSVLMNGQEVFRSTATIDPTATGGVVGGGGSPVAIGDLIRAQVSTSTGTATAVFGIGADQIDHVVVNGVPGTELVSRANLAVSLLGGNQFLAGLRSAALLEQVRNIVPVDKLTHP